MSEKSFENKGVKIAFWVSAIPAQILSGFCFTKIWLWFIVPLGVPEIGIAHAIGLMIFISCFKTIKMHDTTKSEHIVKMWIAWPFLLGLSFIAKLFM
jgi:hypothetical protein